MKSFRQFLIEATMTYQDALKVFNLDKAPASASELNTLYKKLAIKYHPDHGGKTEDMARINAAKDILSKNIGKAAEPSFEEKKAQYQKDWELIFNEFSRVLKSINLPVYVNYFKNTFNEDFSIKTVYENLTNIKGRPTVEYEFSNSDRSTIFSFKIYCDVHSAIMSKQRGSLGSSGTTYEYNYSSHAIVKGKKQVVSKETSYIAKASGSLDFVDKPEFIFPIDRIKKLAKGSVRKTSAMKKRDFDSLFTTRYGGEKFHGFGSSDVWFNVVNVDAEGKGVVVLWDRKVIDKKAFYVIHMMNMSKYTKTYLKEQPTLEQKFGGLNMWGWSESNETYQAFDELLKFIKNKNVKTEDFIKKYCELNRKIFEKM